MPNKIQKNILKEINYRLLKLEDKIFGVSTGHKITLSKEGLKQFPELKNAQFYLLKWHRDLEEMIVVQRKGKKAKEVYHYSYFNL